MKSFKTDSYSTFTSNINASDGDVLEDTSTGKKYIMSNSSWVEVFRNSSIFVSTSIPGSATANDGDIWMVVGA